MSQIRVELQLADGSFTTGMLRAGQSIDSFNRQLLRTNPSLQQFASSNGNVIRSIQQMDVNAKSFLGTMRDLSIVTGLVSMGISKASAVANSWVGDIVRVNAEMEKLTFQMRAMSNTADPFKDAADNVKYLREQAAQMPFSLRTITSAFTKLKATGTDPAAGSLKAIADGVAAFGGSDEQLNRIVLGLTQMSGKAVIQMEELRQQLGESMPGAMQLMARSMGISVADLSKAIATGTVDAKQNLENFYKEIERAYGGTAQRMMQTFSGQLSQLHTNFQQLATNEGGRGFFDQVKTQLQDINTFLRSDMANRIATQLGSGLNALVAGLRTAVEWIWNMRDSLLAIATIAASGVGLVALNGALTATINLVQGSGLAWGILRTNMASAWSTMALGVTGFRSLGTAAIGAQIAAMGAGAAIRTAAAAASALAPIAVILGGGVYLLADHFGLLSNKTKDAYEELVKFGSESRKQASEVIGKREAQLQANLDKAQAAADAGVRNAPQWVERHKKELEDFQKESGKILAETGRKEDEKALAQLTARLDEEMAKKKQAYNTEQVDRQEAYQKELAEAVTQGKTKKSLEDSYREDVLKSREKLHEAEYELLKEEMKRYEDAMASGVEQQAAVYEKGMALLRERMVAKNEELANVRLQRLGAIKNKAPESDDKKVERGAKQLENLKVEVAGLEAAFKGGNDALGELLFKLERGDFGNLKEANEDVQKLHQGLIEVTAQRELLDKMTKGQNKAEAAQEKIKQDLLEREMELKEKEAGRKLTQGEREVLRLQNGYYDGLGDRDKVKKSIEEVTAQLEKQGISLGNVAQIAQKQTFGEQTIARINTVTEAMRTLAGAITQVGSNLNGVNFGNFGTDLAGSVSGAITPVIQNLPGQITDRMKVAMERLMSKGWSQNAAAGIVGNLVTESKLNPGAVNKDDAGPGFDSVGIAQWNKGRLANLQKFAGQQGKSAGDFLTQLDFIDWELRNTHAGVGNRLQLARDAKTAGDIAMREYEVPAASAIAKTGGERIGNAVQAHGLADGKSPAAQASLPLPSVGSPSLALPALPTPKIAEQKEMNAVIDERVDKTQKLIKGAEELAQQERSVEGKEKELARVEALKELNTQMASLKDGAKLTGGAYQKMYEDIKKGEKFGPDVTLDSAKGKELLATAKQLDDTEKEIAATKRATTVSDREKERLERERLEINRQIAEQQKKVADPNYKPDSGALQELRTRLDAYLANVKKAYGEDSEAFRQAQEQKSQILQGQSLLDATTQQAALAKQNQAVEDSLLTQTELRRREYERQIAEIDRVTQAVIAAGGNEVEATRKGEAMKAALRKQYQQETSPLDKQFKEWGDLQNNLAKQSTQWMDSLADGLTGVIMGTTDLKTAAKQLISGILKDIINSGIKKMISDMMGAKNSGGGGGKKGTAGAAARTAASAGGKKAGVGIAHTGGIIGATNLSTNLVNPSVFSGARRFHTGGLIGSGKVPGLKPSEVPIIAQKGEGVFTPEQMASMGGMQQNQAFQINAPITVNGSSGTPEQNDDLARKMAKEMETSMRSVVADEFRKQSRPGNFANTRSR